MSFRFSSCDTTTSSYAGKSPVGVIYQGSASGITFQVGCALDWFKGRFSFLGCVSEEMVQAFDGSWIGSMQPEHR